MSSAAATKLVAARPAEARTASATGDAGSGTALVPYFERLGEYKSNFVEAVRAKMKAALPETPVFYPFRRTLFSAKKPRVVE